MRKLLAILIVLLGALLPWHGTITVFLPEYFRWWKEAILLVLLGVVLVQEIWAWREKKLKKFTWAEILAFLFLFWGVTLVILNPDLKTAMIALRYLGMGFLVFLIFSRLLRNVENSRLVGKNWGQRLFHNFSTAFVISGVLSVLFGTWAEFFGGFEVLQNFYSSTISSWVPGQIIPIFHETGGLIRMQGAKSGPIEFLHLLLAGFALVPFIQTKIFIKVVFAIVLLFGIFLSFSRAAILGAVILIAVFAFQNWNSLFSFMVNWGAAKVFFVILVLAGGALFFIPLPLSLQSGGLVLRSGTIEHFSRPIEAMQTGLKKPFFGNLGGLGPAARMKNLREKNDDKALIAENVFIDYFAQMGVIGLALAIAFFVSTFRNVRREWWGFLAAFFVVMNLATIFDMTPVAIAFFMILAFLQKSDKIASKFPIHS